MYRQLLAATIIVFTQSLSINAQTVNSDTLKAFKTAQKAEKLVKSGKADKITKGIELYKQAGSQGLPSACRFLAEYYRTTTPPDTAQSIHWLEILGDLGDTPSIDRLVDIYSGKLSNEGYSAEANQTKLEEWSKALAGKGNLKGTEAYANCCLLKGDTTQAIVWLEKAAEQESLPAKKVLADIYASPGNNQSPERAFEYASKVAEQGDKECLYLLGNMYHAGFGCEKDLNKAISTLEQCQDTKDSKLLIAICKMEQNDGKMDESTFPVFLEAAENGNATAQFTVGQCYYNGDAVERDTAKAMDWMLKAAEAGIPYAQYFCASQYLSEQGVAEHDEAKGIDWMKKAANSGLPEAQVDLAACYLEGHFVEKDEAKGIDLLKLSAGQGNVTAISILADYYINQCSAEEDHQNGVLLLQSLANNGFIESQFNLAVCYMSSVGTKGLTQEQKLVNDDLKKLADGKELTDMQIGAYWLEKAAEAGYPMAQQNLGLFIIQGNLPGDKTKALEWVRKASDAGLPQSQYTLGILTLTGQAGIKQNASVGVSLLQKAANAGMPQAQNDLGLVYMQGEYGVKKNASAGFNLLKKAAAQGMPASMFYLALCYATGQGTTTNVAEAKKWFQKAAAQNEDPQVKQASQEALKSL